MMMSMQRLELDFNEVLVTYTFHHLLSVINWERGIYSGYIRMRKMGANGLAMKYVRVKFCL